MDSKNSANEQLFKSKRKYLEEFAMVMHLLGKQTVAFPEHHDGDSMSK